MNCLNLGDTRNFEFGSEFHFPSTSQISCNSDNVTPMASTNPPWSCVVTFGTLVALGIHVLSILHHKIIHLWLEWINNTFITVESRFFFFFLCRIFANMQETYQIMILWISVGCFIFWVAGINYFTVKFESKFQWQFKWIFFSC